MYQKPLSCLTTRCVGLLLLQLLPCLKEMAQPPGGVFYHLTTKNGLSSNRITSVLQDSKGYYWIGTEDGLNRFDGSSCKIFRTILNDSNSISNNNCVGGLLQDDLQNIWIGTQQGISEFEPATTKFYRYYLNNPVTTWERVNWIKGMAKDDIGNIYICSYGLWIYNIYSKQWRKYLHDNNNPSSAPDGYLFSPIYDTINKVLWLKGTPGVILFDIKSCMFHYRGFDPQHLLVFQDEMDGSNMVMSNDHKIWNYDPVHHSLIGYSIAGNFKQEFARGKLFDVNRLSADNRNRIWIEHYRYPTTIYSITSKQIDTTFLGKYHTQSALTNFSNLLFIDKNGNYWLGSKLGMSIYDSRSKSISYYLLSPNAEQKESSSLEINCMAEQSGNVLWVGTNLGLYKFDLSNSRLQKIENVFRQDNFVRAIYLQNDSILWIGGQNELVRFQTKQNKLFNPIFVGSGIQSFFAQDDQIWMGTWTKGLYEFSASGDLENHFEKASYGDTRESIYSNNLLCISGSPSKTYFWIGYNGGNGYSKVLDHGKSFQHFKIGLPSLGNIQNIVNCIYEEKNGDVWIGTYGSGLIEFQKHTGNYISYSQYEGLSGNYIDAITEDDSSRIWISTCNGLDILDTRNQSIINTDLDLEQPSNDLYSNCLIGKNKKLFFFAGNRIVSIVPDSFPIQSEASILLLNSFKVFDTEISPWDISNGKPIRLSHDQNFFSIEYSLLKPDPEAHVQYAYKLGGFDRDWNYSKDRGLAKYTNVPPGKYTLSIKARDPAGHWGYSLYPILIEISPPFWKSWWFITFICTICALSIYGLFRYRINQVHRLYQLRTDISKDLHDQIGATLTSISFLSEVAKNKDNTADLTSKTLDRIGQYSRDMIAEMNDIVWIINPLNDSFQKMVDRVQNFAFVLTTSKGISFTFQADPEILHMSLTMKQRKNLYLILKESINNAAKHASCSNLNVDISNPDGLLYAKIYDDGKGISEEQIMNSGNGLQNMRHRAEEVGGCLDILSGADEGTTLILKMPITQNAYRNY